MGLTPEFKPLTEPRGMTPPTAVSAPQPGSSMSKRLHSWPEYLISHSWAVRFEVTTAKSSIPFLSGLRLKSMESQLPPGSLPTRMTNFLLPGRTELVRDPEASPPEHRNVWPGSGSCDGE